MKNATGGANRAAAFDHLAGSISNSSLVSDPDQSAQSISEQLAGDGILIWRMWKSARNRREEIRISLRRWKEHDFADVRIFSASEDGRSLPTNRGVTIGMRQLPEFLRSVDKAYTRARDLGLISERSS